MRTSLILQKVSFLHGVLDPNWIDGNPGQPGPIFGAAISDYIVAELLREISVNLHDREIATRLHGIGKELVTGSSHSLAAGWEDGDDLCPPFPWPVGGPRPRGEDLVMMTEPWLDRVTPAMNDIVLAHALRQLAALTSSEKASHAIKQTGETLLKNASARLFDEYCGTPVKPHVPTPRPKAVAA